MKQRSTQFLRRRKFLIALPVLAVPFIALAFHALGGGTVTGTRTATPSQFTGLNVNLPDAKLKDDKGIDKLGYYEKAAQDSAKLKNLMKEDPYYLLDESGQQAGDSSAEEKMESVTTDHQSSSASDHSTPVKKYNDPNEEKVYRKLAELNNALHPDGVSHPPVTENYSALTTQPALATGNIERLENMMHVMTTDKDSTDPEMNQLNGMLEKILDIQHPDLAREKLQERSSPDQDKTFSVSKEIVKDNISLLDAGDKREPETSNFYGLPASTTETITNNAIEAVIHENQTLVSGSVVKMRLVNDIYINGHFVPKDNFLFGIASLNNERLEIAITSIRDGQSLYPVKLEIYDLDGIAGIYIPGTITRDVAKQSAAGSLQSIGMTTLDPSLGAQAASAGIETAKNLLGKKVKIIKVQVKAGYKLLLKNKITQL